MRPPTCSECIHWPGSPVVILEPEERACLVGYRLVRRDTVADETCFERVVVIKTPRARD